ncbi:MAG: NAD(P)H-hydrate dehydratase [Candidatus Aminicenantes bacterium]|nr:NAD(P)H-hydrate dehydratase [Candidatus Aminicenantes bacterium]
MKILTAGEMREIDRRTIEEFGIPGAVLMENAGIGVVAVLQEQFPHLAGERIVVVCGRGNNGGDGFVVARHLHNLGARPKVFLLARKHEIKGDAALNLGIAEKLGLEIVEAVTLSDRGRLKKALRSATLIVDAVFGTGLSKPAEGFPAAVIEDINDAPGFTVSVDLPSGLSSDTFRIIGPTIRADLTVALAAPKIAHFFPPAEKYAGKLEIVDISVPPALFESAELRLSLAGPDDVVPFFEERPRDGHKGTFGHVLVLAGSRGKTGAAVLAGKAAYRAGAGLVTIAAPASCLPVIARSMSELMTEPLPETREGTVAAEALPRLTQLLSGKDVVVIGPGLSAQPETADLVRRLLPKIRVQVVVDADGLNILAGHPAVLKAMRRPPILTPHPGEFARLLGLTVPEILNDRLTLASRYAVDHKAIVVLKGYRTLVAGPGGRVSVNPTGNPGMGTGGSGDVLSGVLGALAAGRKDIFGAAVAAVYLHGAAGDAASDRLGERAVVAGDLIRFLPEVQKALEAPSGCGCGEHEP